MPSAATFAPPPLAFSGRSPDRRHAHASVGMAPERPQGRRTRTAKICAAHTKRRRPAVVTAGLRLFYCPRLNGGGGNRTRVPRHIGASFYVCSPSTFGGEGLAVPPPRSPE